jgi:hypothetical protein
MKNFKLIPIQLGGMQYLDDKEHLNGYWNGKNFEIE